MLDRLSRTGLVIDGSTDDVRKNAHGSGTAPAKA